MISLKLIYRIMQSSHHLSLKSSLYFQQCKNLQNWIIGDLPTTHSISSGHCLVHGQILQLSDVRNVQCTSYNSALFLSGRSSYLIAARVALAPLQQQLFTNTYPQKSRVCKQVLTQSQKYGNKYSQSYWLVPIPDHKGPSTDHVCPYI